MRSTEDQWCKQLRVPGHESPHTNWPVQLMARQREEIRRHGLHVHSNLADGLYGVGVKQRSCLVSSFDELGYRLNHAGFVIGPLHGHQRASRSDFRFEGVHVDDPIGVNWQDYDLAAGSPQDVRCGQNRGMLHGRCHKAIPLQWAGKQALNDEVVGFRGAAGEDDAGRV